MGVSFLGFASFALLAALAPDAHENLFARLGFTLAFASIALLILFLHFTSGINRYEVTEAGLRIHRFLRTTFHSWPEITGITWNPAIQTVFVHGRDKIIFYSSANCFYNLKEFLLLIHKQSNCQLSSWLAKVLSNPKAQLDH